MPKAFTDQEKKMIEQNLIEQGKRQFSAFGLKKTNIEEIAKAAGISKGAFYLFFGSKEELFMKVSELLETEFREEALALIHRPGETPRIRLAALLNDMFDIWRKVPMLHYFTNADYQVILRRLPPEKLGEHLQGDMSFVRVLFTRLDEENIHIRISPDLFMQMMYAMFMINLHGDDFGQGGLQIGSQVMLELIAAYSLGEITLESSELLKKIKEMRENDIRN
jgi:AcrR family transcriptional regulator